MTARVKWQSSTEQDLCLFQEEQKLACWENTQKVTEQFQITLAKTMLFTLKNNNDDVLAKQVIELHSSVNEGYRRKLKSDWSVF